jgi:parvulin-like peptidyl-prolyl isomerase
MNRSLYRGLFFVLGALSASLGAGCRKAPQVVVARVGNQTISAADVQSRLEGTPYGSSMEGRRQFISLLIREKVLLAEARKTDLARDVAYKQALERFKTQWEQRLKDYEESLLVESFIRRLRSKDLAVTDSEVQRFYQDHQSDYMKPVEIQVSHILLSSQNEAESALARLKSGEAFETVAREMSKDAGTAARGGRLKPIRRGMLVPDFETAAFALKNGQVSDLVKTSFGFHIIKKTGQTELPPRTMDAAKEEIRARLERDKFDQWVTQKQALQGVTIDEKALASVAPGEARGPYAQEP